jgi:hypothetical protein
MSTPSSLVEHRLHLATCCLVYFIITIATANLVVCGKNKISNWISFSLLAGESKQMKSYVHHDALSQKESPVYYPSKYPTRLYKVHSNTPFKYCSSDARLQSESSKGEDNGQGHGHGVHNRHRSRARCIASVSRGSRTAAGRATARTWLRRSTRDGVV